MRTHLFDERWGDRKFPSEEGLTDVKKQVHAVLVKVTWSGPDRQEVEAGKIGEGKGRHR